MNDSGAAWADDLFKRHQQANDLVGFIESRLQIEASSGEGRSQVIAVDAEYGIGKTFFLKRLARQLENTSSVAYVDAWADDFVGEPLISLAATIKKALEPLMEEPTILDGWAKVAAKAGKVAWIATKGAGTQVAKLAISAGGVEAIAAVVDQPLLDKDDLTDAISDGLSSETGDGSGASKSIIDHRQYLNMKMADYEEAKDSVESLRSALTELAYASEAAGRRLPVYIIIDELDRCRPDYAIRVLEQIKHLFSVQEIVFILGINSTQLARSVSHAYGVEFDGKAYLDRFIDRTLVLPFPDLSVLCQSLLDQITAKDARQIWFADAVHSKNSQAGLTKYKWIAMLLEHYKIPPRGVLKFFDRLQTSLAYVGEDPIMMNYLCELLAEDVSGTESKVARPWRFILADARHGAREEHDGARFFSETKQYFAVNASARDQRQSQSRVFDELLWQFKGRGERLGAEFYHLAIKKLAKFEGPLADSEG